MTLRLTEQDIRNASRTRAAGFFDAVLALSQRDGDIILVESDIWHKATIRFAKQPGQIGLGDAVAAVAQPIAGLIDSVLKTNISGCSGCAQRRDALNRLMPKL